MRNGGGTHVENHRRLAIYQVVLARTRDTRIQLLISLS